MKIPRKITPEKCEALLTDFAFNQEARKAIYLPTRYEGPILGDLWASILTGTICQKTSDSPFITWGLTEWDYNGDFPKTLPGITAIHLCSQLKTDGDQKPIEARSMLVRDITYKKRGLLEHEAGNSRTLVEFGSTDSLLLRADSSEKRQLRFANLIRDFRWDVDLSYRIRGLDTANPSGALKSMIRWLFELHNNARLYGSEIIQDRAPQPCIRFMRLKGHLATSRDNLISRSEEGSRIRQYLQDISHSLGQKTQGVLEASVTDFGPGLIDHFLSSTTGVAYSREPRRAILNDLILEKLSSSSNPEAGEGLRNALLAARSLAAFVSLRTDRFWLVQNFARHDSPFKLVDVNKGQRADVVGTHWQLLMPMAMP